MSKPLCCCCGGGGSRLAPSAARLPRHGRTRHCAARLRGSPRGPSSLSCRAAYTLRASCRERLLGLCTSTQEKRWGGRRSVPKHVWAARPQLCIGELRGRKLLPHPTCPGKLLQPAQTPRVCTDPSLGLLRCSHFLLLVEIGYFIFCFHLGTLLIISFQLVMCRHFK